ncbi:hypothetical protein D9M71_802730 [compost metagenome]
MAFLDHFIALLHRIDSIPENFVIGAIGICLQLRNFGQFARGVQSVGTVSAQHSVVQFAQTALIQEDL